MRLVTQNGQLDLPSDFSLTMERTNPLLSGEGDASVPATLPSSSRNLAVLGHLERIDRAERYANKVEAIIQVGPVQKHGQLVMDTAHRKEGIDASFAIDSSDLYVKAKEKSLKAIIKEGENEKLESFASVDAAIARMQDIYTNGDSDDTYDYTVLPVVVSPYEEDGVVHWQFNNEIDSYEHLVSQARDVREGDILMSVPKGYGVAPFLKLHKMLDVIFEALGYTVTENCFSPDMTQQNPGNKPVLVMLHNCADCLVTGTLYYRDMVPSCTLSDFLEWMLGKFHAQPVVDSSSKTAKIVLMEDILAGSDDDDWTGKIEGDWKVYLQQKKRIVLTPKGQGEEDAEKGKEIAIGDGATDLETLARPAAMTMNGLVKKYGGYVVANEDQFDKIATNNAPYWDCLVLRRAEGMFYRIDRKLEPCTVTIINPSNNNSQQVTTSLQKPVAIGTDHMCYDRYNSDETEVFVQDDTIPAMTIEKSKRVAPYIGKRIHFHSTYEGGENEDTEQPIIMAWSVRTGSVLLSPYLNSGTTQDFVPLSAPLNLGAGGVHYGIDTPFALTNEAMYAIFWKRYNGMLLNQNPHHAARVDMSVAQFLGMDMSRPKLVDGQPLLPVKASMKMNERKNLAEIETIALKQCIDSVEDTEISPSDNYNGLLWTLENDADDVAQRVYETLINAGITLVTLPYGIEVPLQPNEWAYQDIQVMYNDDSIYLGHPLREGETRTVKRKYDIALIVKRGSPYNGVNYFIFKSSGVYYRDNGDNGAVAGGQMSATDLSEYLSDVLITTIFTASAF